MAINGIFCLEGDWKTRLDVGEDTMTLDDFQRVLAGKCNGRVLYMGACETLATEDRTLMELCQVTGASAVAGYTREVDFLVAAAFEVLLLSDLVGAVRMKPAYQRMITRYPDLTAHLGFRMATSSWASP